MRKFLHSMAIFFLVSAFPMLPQQKNIFNTTGSGSDDEISLSDLIENIWNETPLIDTRNDFEYSIGHIPGSINFTGHTADSIVKFYPEKDRGIILYCSGLYSSESKNIRSKLADKGYKNIKIFQPGLPFWKATGNPAAVNDQGVNYIFYNDRTALFIDARDARSFSFGSLPDAINIIPGNNSERLSGINKSTAIIVFSDEIKTSMLLADQLCKQAFFNTSYYEGKFDNLLNALSIQRTHSLR
jgi:rhodanese-related sulfurtransferase